MVAHDKLLKKGSLIRQLCRGPQRFRSIIIDHVILRTFCGFAGIHASPCTVQNVSRLKHFLVAGLESLCVIRGHHPLFYRLGGFDDEKKHLRLSEICQSRQVQASTSLPLYSATSPTLWTKNIKEMNRQGLTKTFSQKSIIEVGRCT